MSLVKLLAQFHMQTETSSPLFFYIVIISVKLWTGNTINFRTFGVSGNNTLPILNQEITSTASAATIFYQKSNMRY